jgi:hypothetical protein
LDDSSHHPPATGHSSFNFFSWHAVWFMAEVEKGMFDPPIGCHAQAGGGHEQGNENKPEFKW